MATWQYTYEKWLAFTDLEPNLKQELENMQDDPDRLEDAFYKELAFGTGGMRGVLGPGINRMNIYTVRRAVAGLAEYLEANDANVPTRGVVVAYDSRYKSREFAVEVARVLGVRGIKTYIFDSMRPTPVLSFAVRYLKTVAGVMITASHNPPEYNGFKVYNDDGGQIVPSEAEAIIASIQQAGDELAVPVLNETQLENRNHLRWISSEVDNAYQNNLLQMSKLSEVQRHKPKDLGIVYTPLHGTGYTPVMNGLDQLHFPRVTAVVEQTEADPEFSTVASPNPEEHQAFKMAIDKGLETDADILLGTDPDADRLGAAVKNDAGGYTVLTGNQLGVLMLDYILSRTNKQVLKNARVIKTIVTTELGRRIAESYGVQTIDTLTGFKFIGEKIREFDRTDEAFVFGFEESYGYLIASFARDKDAVQAAMIASEMAQAWKDKGKTLLEALDVLYEQYGYYKEAMSSITLKGIEGNQQIEAMMSDIRHSPPQTISGLQVEVMEDYLNHTRYSVGKSITSGHETLDFPAENVVKFLLEEDSWVCLRPSGTEPKIKCYYAVQTNDETLSEQRLAQMKQEMESLMDQLMQR